MSLYYIKSMLTKEERAIANRRYYLTIKPDSIPKPRGDTPRSAEYKKEYSRLYNLERKYAVLELLEWKKSYGIE
jgi:hypothetical protein